MEGNLNAMKKEKVLYIGKLWINKNYYFHPSYIDFFDI